MNLDHLTAANEDVVQSVGNEDCFNALDKMPSALANYITTIGDLIDNHSEEDFLKAAAVEVKNLVLTDDLLSDTQMTGSADTYKRHQLYVDPEGRFTVLALVWQPGQFTCVHGHNAWGVVGVHQGNISVDCFELRPDASDPAALVQTVRVSAGMGDVSCVSTAPSGIHRLGNASDAVAITVHTYGMDLSEHPASINVVYSD